MVPNRISKKQAQLKRAPKKGAKPSKKTGPLVSVVQNNGVSKNPAKATKRHTAMTRHIKSGHGMRYLAALTNPHCDFARGCNIPDEAARHSFKVAGKGRFVFTLSPGERIMIFPMLGCSSDTPLLHYVQGQATAFQATNAYYTYATAPVGLAYNTLQNAALPFNQGQLYTSGIQYRHVVTGFKVRYSGTVLNRGGTAIWFEQGSGGPPLIDVGTVSTTKLGDIVNAAATKPQTRYVSFNNKDEHEFVYCDQVLNQGNSCWSGGQLTTTFNTGDLFWPAVEEDDLVSFRTYSCGRFGSSTTGQNGPFPRAFLALQNTTASGSVEYTLEFVTHVEYCGGTAIPMQTPSPIAVEDARKVRNVVAQSKAVHAQNPDEHPAKHAVSIMETLEDAAGDALKGVAHAALAAVSDPSNIARAAAAFGAMFL